jgi:hypothetical protein
MNGTESRKKLRERIDRQDVQVNAMREALTSARAALIRAGFVGPSDAGLGDPEINMIDAALTL